MKLPNLFRTNSPRDAQRGAQGAAKVAALVAITSLLAACGGVTVQGDDVSGGASDTEVAREDSGSSGTDASDKKESETTTSRESGSGSGGSRPSSRDEAAAEVSELPEISVERTPEELDYLDGLTKGGVNVQGVEDQLIATAGTYCEAEANAENVTVDAVAGQLIAQGRTDVAEDQAAEVSTLIKDIADRTYC